MPNFAASGSELSGPVPVAAGVDLAAMRWGVVFNQPLLPAALAPGNWLFQTGGNFYDATSAVALEQHVGGALVSAGEAGPGEDVSYDATPADVTSAAGVPAPAFADFPLG